MTVANAGQVRAALCEPSALGGAFARHAYGMRRWVDQIGRKLELFVRPEAKALAARLVGDNARHMLLFRERAGALGIDPDSYRAPVEGEAIYERLERLTDPVDIAAFALGSLDHFSELLAVYRSPADGESAAVIEQVAADVEEHRALLRSLLGGEGEQLRREAERLYEARELVEVEGYARL